MQVTVAKQLLHIIFSYDLIWRCDADAREVIEEYGSTAFLFTAKYSSAEILKIMVEHYKLYEIFIVQSGYWI